MALSIKCIEKPSVGDILTFSKMFGSRWYFSHRPCAKGHNGLRYVTSRNCIECHRDANRNSMSSLRAKNHDKFIQVERDSRARARDRLGEKGVHRRSRSSNLFHKYGIRIEDYERMLADQGGVCAICGAKPSPHKKNKGYLDVDHDHLSGAIRGLLCRACNQGMIAVDRIDDWAKKAVVYMKLHRRA